MVEWKGSINISSMLLGLCFSNPNFLIFSGLMQFCIQSSLLIEFLLLYLKINLLIRFYMILYLTLILLRFLAAYAMLPHFKLIEPSYSLEQENVFS